MEANRNIVPDYREDMCQKTLDILSRVVYVDVNPEWTETQCEEKIAAIRAALKQL
jgi:hypothetical protein